MPACPRPRVTVSSDVAASQGLRVLPRPLPRHVRASGSCHWDLSVNDAVLSAPAEVGTSTQSLHLVVVGWKKRSLGPKGMSEPQGERYCQDTGAPQRGHGKGRQYQACALKRSGWRWRQAPEARGAEA